MRPIVVFATLFLVPLASAGTVDDPEIDDGADTSFPDSDHDVIKAWITEDLVATEHGLAIEFHLLLAADYDMLPALFAVYESYRVGFKTTNMADDQEWYIDAKGSRDSIDAVVTTVPVGGESAACRFSRAPVGGYADIPDEERLEDSGLAQLIDGKQIVCQVPVDRLDGFDPASDSVYDLWVEQRWVVRGPLSSGDAVGPEVIGTYDRAPDSGFGRVWELASQAEAVLGNASFPVDLSHNFTAPSNDTYVYDWSSPGGNLSALLDVEALQGNVTVVVQVGNETLLNATSSGQQDVVAPAGNGTITFRYAGFVGNATLKVVPSIPVEAPPVDDGPVDDAPVDEEGNQTIDVAPSDKDTPAVALPVLVVALAIAVRRR